MSEVVESNVRNRQPKLCNFQLTILLLMLLIPISSSCFERQLAKKSNSSLSANNWETVIEELVKKKSRKKSFTEQYIIDTEMSIDYFHIHGNRVILVISKLRDTIGVFQQYLVEYDPLSTSIYYVEQSNRPHILVGGSLDWFKSLIETDSLWSLFGNNGFWKSDKFWKESYDKLKLKTFSDGETYFWEGSFGVDYLIGVNSLSIKTDTSVPIVEDLLGLILTYQTGQHPFFRDQSNKLTIRQEFLARSEKRFCAIISKRSETEGVFKALIGKQIEDSIFYKFVSTDNSDLSGNSMKRYLKRLNSNSLWQYFGEYGFWEEEDKFEELYESASPEVFSAPIN